MKSIKFIFHFLRHLFEKEEQTFHQFEEIEVAEKSKVIGINEKSQYEKGKPVIHITGIEVSQTDDSIILSGNIEDEGNSGSPVLTVNDRKIYVYRTGEWSKSLQVKDGLNEFHFTAINAGGGVATYTKIYEHNNPPPCLHVNQFPLTTDLYLFNITGTLTDERDDFPTLSINNVNVPVSPSGDWFYHIELEEGENVIRIRAKNKWDKETKVTKKIIYEVPPPSIKLNNVPQTPVFKTIRISGNIIDPNDRYPKVTINDQPVHVNDYGHFSGRFKLEEGINTFVVEGVNLHGKVSTQIAKAVFGKTPPMVKITEAPEKVTEPHVRICGVVMDDNDPRPTATINDEPVELDNNGFFNHRVSLLDGMNVIKLVGTNEFTLSSQTTKQVIFEAPKPILTLNKHKRIVDEREIILSGTLIDEQDEDIQVSVKLNGETHTVRANDEHLWGVHVNLLEGPNQITVLSRNCYLAESKIETKIDYYPTFNYKWYKNLKIED